MLKLEAMYGFHRIHQKKQPCQDHAEKGLPTSLGRDLGRVVAITGNLGS